MRALLGLIRRSLLGSVPFFGRTRTRGAPHGCLGFQGRAHAGETGRVLCHESGTQDALRRPQGHQYHAHVGGPVAAGVQQQQHYVGAPAAMQHQRARAPAAVGAPGQVGTANGTACGRSTASRHLRGGKSTTAPGPTAPATPQAAKREGTVLGTPARVSHESPHHSDERTSGAIMHMWQHMAAVSSTPCSMIWQSCGSRTILHGCDSLVSAELIVRATRRTRHSMCPREKGMIRRILVS